MSSPIRTGRSCSCTPNSRCDEALRGKLRLYALLAPHLAGFGVGNSGWCSEIGDNKLIHAQRQNVHLLMACSTGFSRRSVGYVGFFVQQALARNHQVTAFVRSPESIALNHERLNVLKGNATDENQLVDGMQNHYALVSTLGPRKPFQRTSLLHDSALAATRAMKRSGMKRLVVLSAAAHFPGIPNAIVRFVLRNHMRDSLAMEKIVQASGLDGRSPDRRVSRRKNIQPIGAGGCRSEKGFHAVQKSGCSIHAQRNRARQTLSPDRRYREITCRSPLCIPTRALAMLNLL